MKTRTLLVVAFALPAPALAASPDAHRQHAGQSMVIAQASAEMSEGEIRRIDKDAHKMTIKHGPLKNLDMPPMTMVFRVKDPAMLDMAKAGDKIRFRAEKVGGAYTVTSMESAK
jgi:Cu(I)/Ag(I) efflux system protein CusF